MLELNIATGQSLVVNGKLKDFSGSDFPMLMLGARIVRKLIYNGVIFG